MTPTCARPHPRAGARALAWWVATVAWAAVIFALSAQAGTESSGLSDAVARAVRAISGPALNGLADDTLHLLVRKGAHVGAYALLGLLLALAWRAAAHFRHERGPGRRHEPGGCRGDVHASGRRHTGKSNPVLAMVGPWLIAAAYAVSDELHQVLVSGREGRASDVLIDSAGAAVGIGVAVLMWGTRRRRIVKSTKTPPEFVTDHNREADAATDAEADAAAGARGDHGRRHR